MPQANTRVIRDVLHGDIELDELDCGLVETKIFQRLRYVRQNGISYLVYPSLNISRFEHSLGVFHVARNIASAAIAGSEPTIKEAYLADLIEALPKELREGAGKPEDLFCRVARWYGLLHDIGHLPFSHLAEHCLQSQQEKIYPASKFSKLHESAGAFIVTNDEALRQALQKDPAAAWLVSQLLSDKLANPVLQPLKDIVDSDVDADRIDATARDGLLSGSEFGHYDSERLTRHAVIVKQDERKWRVLFTTRAVSAIESLLVERCNTYRWIHYHHKVAAFANAFRHALTHINPAIEQFRADNYVDKKGYLDDSKLFAMLGSLTDGPEHVACARDAILWRSKTAHPLWKRRDEFRRLSGEVAEGKGELEEFEKTGLALNKLANDVQEVEQKLNEGLDDSIRFLASKLQLDPFESSKFDDHIGKYMIVEHRSGRIMPITQESRMIRSLNEVVKGEPAFAVSVVASDENFKKRHEELIESFRQVARQMLVEAA